MIALVFCGDLKICPYVNRYIERIELKQEDYKVFFWNRGGYPIDETESYVAFDFQSEMAKKKINKLFDIIRFKAWLIKQLDSYKPEKIIVLSTLTGIVLGEYLKSKHYILDIRDYSYEHVLPYYNIEKRIIKNSFFTAISSKEFIKFLPEQEYVIAHNFNRKEIDSKYFFERKKGKKDERINFVWNGSVRYFDFQKQYLNGLKNDDRFQIIYHGNGPELKKYKEYCEKNGFKNVIFTGTYDNRDKPELLKDADILNNCYGFKNSQRKKLECAVSNRFYDGLIYRIPQLVETGGYKDAWTRKTGVGIALDPVDNFADRLYEFYMNVNAELFNDSCRRALDSVIAEDDEYIKRIDHFIEIETE